MIVTPYGHVLYTKMLQIGRPFFSAILRNRGGYGKPTAHAHVMLFDPLPVGQNGMPNTKTMESLEDVCTVVPLLRDHPVVHTDVVFEEGWSFIRGRKQCKPKHVSSGIVVLNVRLSLIRGVSQEGDYCSCRNCSKAPPHVSR